MKIQGYCADCGGAIILILEKGMLRAECQMCANQW